MILNNNKDKIAGTFNPVKYFLQDNIVIDDNSIVVIGYNYGDTFHVVKEKYPEHKIIVYQLEQLFNYQSLWFNPDSANKMVLDRTKQVKEWLDNADEIWEYDMDNFNFLKSLGYNKIKYLPLSVYYNHKYKNTVKSPKYDIIFYGAMNNKRYEFLKILDEQFNLLVICNQDTVKKRNYKFKHTKQYCYGQKLFNHVFNAKLVINLHYYNSHLQEQPRLIELLSNNVEVLSQQSKRNYLNVNEFSTKDEMISKVKEVLERKNIYSFYHVYNEIKWLPLQKKWCDNNNIKMYVIDHMSTDGTWEFLQENNIPFHRFDNGGIFYLDQLQVELKKVIDKIKPEWLLYGDPDTFLQVPGNLHRFISDIDKNGYDGLETTTIQMYNIGERLKDHPILTYYYGAYAKRKQVRLVKYSKNIKFRGDVLDGTTNPYKDGYFINYGGTKPLIERKEYLERHKKAWEIGMNKSFGTHLQKAVDNNCLWNKSNLTNFKDSEMNKDLFKSLSLDNVLKGYTSKIIINNNIVHKIIDYKPYTKELVLREVYWLQRLEQYNIAPKYFGNDDNSIRMSYCGEVATKDDFQNHNIQLQLLNILRILLENHCFYNDFKIDNFTILNGKLYIIDFGWCPLVKEDYTCDNNIESDLQAKPYKNIFHLFNEFKVEPTVIVSEKSNYLTKEDYYKQIETEKKINPEHWLTNKNNDTYDKRWEYHHNTIEILKSLNPKSILEAGTMGIKLAKNSDTIDLDLPTKGWRLTYKPTYNHDLTKFPWANIKDKQYDCFVALRVFHHMKTEQEKYLTEMFRISNNVILALPQKDADIYKDICKPTKELKSNFSDTTILVYEKQTIDMNISIGLTIGLVYSGRLGNEFFNQWIDDLVKDIQLLKNKPEFIIINNSNNKLLLDNYQKYFSNIKVIKGHGNISRINRPEVAKMLSDSYNIIIDKSTNDLIHLREDDIIPNEGSFEKIFNYINDSAIKPVAVAGIYCNRRLPEQEVNYVSSLNTPIKIDYTGTGFLIFRKNSCPKFIHDIKGIQAHDWAWGLSLKNSGKELWMLPDAVCKHYKDKKNYVLPQVAIDRIIPSYTHTKISNQEKRDEVVVIRKLKWSK